MNDEKKYWDEKIKERSGKSNTKFPQRGDMDEIENLTEWIKELHAQRNRDEFVILDIGPGTGIIYDHICKAMPGIFSPDNYKMIEISPVAAELCKKNTGNEPFVIDDPTKIPTGDNSVDLVICHSVLMHTPPEQIEKLFPEIVRVSREYIYVGEYMFGTKELADHNWKHDYLEWMTIDLIWVDCYRASTVGRYGILLCKNILSEELWYTLHPNGTKELVKRIIALKKHIRPNIVGVSHHETLREPQSDKKSEKKNEKNVRRSGAKKRKSVKAKKRS